MDIRIQNIGDMKIDGVSVCLKKECTPYLESYFDWTAYPMTTSFNKNSVIIGILTAWHNKPEFDQIEYHEDYETFYFASGSSLMIFCDIKDGKPVMESAQIAKIDAGTEITIAPGKGHFVPVGITDAYQAVVVAPKQEAPRVILPEIIRGV